MVNTNTLIGCLVFVAIVASVLDAAVTYNTINNFKQSGLSGYATFGTVNLSVESAVLINFTTEIINFGSGKVFFNNTNATLNTAAGATNVTGGNWTLQNRGYIVIENLGNNNVSLNLMSDLAAAAFIGGTGPQFQYNISSLETNACTNTTDGGINMSNGAYIKDTFIDVNTSSPGQRVCDRLSYADSRDTVRVDVKIVVPYDSLISARGARLTASVAAVA